VKLSSVACPSEDALDDIRITGFTAKSLYKNRKIDNAIFCFILNETCVWYFVV